MIKKVEPKQRIRLDRETAALIRKYYNLLPDTMREPFVKFEKMLNKNESLTDAQHNYLDGMYEAVLGNITGDKVDVHVDLKNKSKLNLHY